MTKARRNPQETFAATRARLFHGLVERGWSPSSPTLKVPHVTSPDRQVKLWFKPQAVYISSPGGDLGDARSLYSDIRGLTADHLERSAYNYLRT